VSKGVPYLAYNISFFQKKDINPLCQLIEWITLYETMPKHVHGIKPTPNAKGFVSNHVMYQVLQQNKFEMCIGIKFNN
jgi:hypothetical protein